MSKEEIDMTNEEIALMYGEPTNRLKFEGHTLMQLYKITTHIQAPGNACYIWVTVQGQEVG